LKSFSPNQFGEKPYPYYFILLGNFVLFYGLVLVIEFSLKGNEKKRKIECINNLVVVILTMQTKSCFLFELMTYCL